MRAELTITAVTDDDLAWAIDLRRAADTADGVGTHRSELDPAQFADRSLIVRDRASIPCALIVLEEHRGPTNDLHVEVILGDRSDRDLAFTAVRMITADRMDASPRNRVIIELAEPDRGWADDMLGPCFVETARLTGARRVDGHWCDLSVLVCDAITWGVFESE